MIEVDYFTDGSITVLDDTKTKLGFYGYVYIDKYFDIRESYVTYSNILDTNYLECKVIYDCLRHIQIVAKPGIKYTIFTDSSNCYELLQKCFNNRLRTNRTSHFYYQIQTTVSLLREMTNENIDIHIIDVKGHCNSLDDLQKYLTKKTPGFNLQYLKLILYGNRLIDTLVNAARFRYLYMNIPYNNSQR